MRDLAVTLIVFGSIPFIFRRPWIGIMMWVWLSLMNPHRLTWGFAYNMPFAMLIAATTILAIIVAKERYKFPWCGITVTLIVMVVWMSVTTLFAIHPEWAVVQWEKVMKIQIMNLVCLYVLSTRQHIDAMVWVTAGSMAFYGIKGGIFTLTSGGENLVFGPAGTFIEENNTLGLATIMVIPLIYYLVMRVQKRWMKLGLVGAMVLCGFSALGSHSRGGLLAMFAMLAFLWLKSRHKVVSLVALLLLVPPMIGFMPEKWSERMDSISEYQEDASAQGRINSWRMAINLTKDRPVVGGGFDLYSEYTFGKWAPNPTAIHSAHSNYFQMLGEHGYPGLILFVLLLLLTWITASRVIRRTKSYPELRWVGDLCRMIQVSLIGYSAGGAFLNLAYFDLPYFLISLVVLSRFYVDRELALGQGASPSKDSSRLVPGRRSMPSKPQVA